MKLLWGINFGQPFVGALLCLAFLLCSAATHGQKITFAGTTGCAVLAPGVPARLKAFPGTGKVRLTWRAPENNACVDEYVVDVKEVSQTNRHFFEPWKHHTKTDKYQTTIEGLENGKVYEFSVRAVSQRFDNRYATATVRATPRSVCVYKRPGRVQNLRATAGDQFVELCWEGPENDACVSEYKVRTRVKTDYYRSHYDYPEKLSKGGCVKIANLSNNVKYEFSVLGYHRRAGIGIPAYIVVSPRHWASSKPHEIARPHGHEHFDPWKCHAIPNSYPRCEANKWKLCKKMSCSDHAAAGNCDAPFMQKVDHERKTITQYCSSHCGCPKSPSRRSESRFLFLDDYCCKKPNVSYKIKKPFN